MPTRPRSGCATAEFTLDDFLAQIKQVRKMGSLDEHPRR